MQAPPDARAAARFLPLGRLQPAIVRGDKSAASVETQRYDSDASDKAATDAEQNDEQADALLLLVSSDFSFRFSTPGVQVSRRIGHILAPTFGLPRNQSDLSWLLIAAHRSNSCIILLL